MLRCFLVPRKENLTGVSTGSTGRSKNLDPTSNPTDAGRPDWFPSLVCPLTTLLKFLGPANPKNPGQRPLTQNFWVIVKFWVAVNFGSKNLGQRKILGQRFWVIAEICVSEKFWVKKFGSTKRFGSKNLGQRKILGQSFWVIAKIWISKKFWVKEKFGVKFMGHCKNLVKQKVLGQNFWVSAKLGSKNLVKEII